MKYAWLLLLTLVFSDKSYSNMAYMGPKDAHVSGQQVLQNVRVKHELLTADMRKLPGGTISVFADYQLLCTGKSGTIRFLFVASSTQPVSPEIILDGKVIACKPVTSDYRPSLYENPTPTQRDSLSQIIGYDLINGDYHYHHLLDLLFVFDVEMDPGMHHLKIGYECTPTGYENGNLRYTTFPYFLGNIHTRNLYDSIFVKILLPEDVEYECNFDAKKEGGNILSGNIAGFQKSHIAISIFKNVEKELANGWDLFMASQILLWVIIGFLSLLYLRKRKDLKKPFFITLSAVLPVSLIIGFVFYFCMIYYYQHFEKKYGLFLEGSWGKGYLFLIVPVLIIFSAIAWVVLAVIYQYLVHGKKWDPTNLIVKKIK